MGDIVGQPLTYAVAHNPRLMGLGIDENTAVVVVHGRLRVLGDGAVYVVDGEDATHSNISEGGAEDALSMFDVRLHVLARDDGFDLSPAVVRSARPRKRRAGAAIRSDLNPTRRPRRRSRGLAS
ncbi:Cyanophycinase [compost metagenome]